MVRIAFGFFASVLLIWLALEILAQIWVWLILVAFLVSAIWLLVAYLHWRRTHRL